MVTPRVSLFPGPRLAASLLFAVVFAIPVGAWAQPDASDEAVPTRVMVRVRSNDAKLLQDPVGGARVTIRAVGTGEVLAEGRVEGRSGSTEAIMRKPHARGASIYDTSGAAGYLATLRLTRPTQVEISAEGPLDYPQAMQRAATTMWLVPGEDVLGDGVVLTLHGFIVEVLGAEAAASGEAVEVDARVRMLCGCPTKPGGLWDADRYAITAQLLRDDVVLAEAPMRYAGSPSRYEADVPVPETGATAVRVVASDAARVNFGVATRELTGN